MASPVGRVSDYIACSIDVFQLFTGYLVIASEDLETTSVIDAELKLLEVRPGLSDKHLLACLEDAYGEIGPDPGANFIASRLGWSSKTTSPAE